MSDVPLGAMLSGGLDSSLIVALMARHMDRAGRDVRRRLRRRGLRAARRPPRRRRARRRPPRARGRARHATPTTSAKPDLAPRRAARRPLLARLPRRSASWRAEHVTVALSGQGADELFGGYRKHRVASLAERWGRVPGAAARRARPPRSRRGPGRAGRLVDALAGRRPRRARCSPRAGSCTPTCAASCSAARWPSTPAPPRRVLRGRLAGAPGAAPLEAALYLDARLGLVDDMLTYFDRASMACSLEVRVPFLDHELVELARGSRPSTRSSRLQGKHVLRLAREGPRAGLRARRSASAASSTRRSATWVGADGGALVDRLLLAPDPAYAAVVDRARGRARRRASGAPAAPAHANLLLALVMLELWLERVPAARAGRRPGRAAAA